MASPIDFAYRLASIGLVGNMNIKGFIIVLPTGLGLPIGFDRISWKLHHSRSFFLAIRAYRLASIGLVGNNRNR